MVENFEDMITRFDKIHEHDRQTQTDRRTPHYGMYVATLALHRAAKRTVGSPERKMKFADTLSRFSIIHQRDRQTDRQTDGRTAARWRSLARQLPK